MMLNWINFGMEHLHVDHHADFLATFFETGPIVGVICRRDFGGCSGDYPTALRSIRPPTYHHIFQDPYKLI